MLFLRRLYATIELHDDHLLFRHRINLPPKRVDAPAYYSVARGITEISLE